MRLTMRRIEGLQENRVKENLARAEKRVKNNAACGELEERVGFVA